MTRRFLTVTTLLLLISLFPVLSVWGGGWAVVTLSELPENISAGQPVTIRFAVRQHGQRLLGGLDAAVIARNAQTGEKLEARAEDDQPEGYYQARLTFPEPGEWSWSIDAFGREHPMPDLTVQAAPASAPALESPQVFVPPQTAVFAASALLAVLSGYLLLWRKSRSWAAAVFVLALVTSGFGIATGQERASSPAPVSPPVSAPGQSEIERGKALFVAKGCLTCHTNTKITQRNQIESFSIGPDLTSFTASPDYLRLWLADPGAVKPNTEMPNLELSEAEIELLVAFINWVPAE